MHVQMSQWHSGWKKADSELLRCGWPSTCWNPKGEELSLKRLALSLLSMSLRITSLLALISSEDGVRDLGSLLNCLRQQWVIELNITSAACTSGFRLSCHSVVWHILWWSLLPICDMTLYLRRKTSPAAMQSVLHNGTDSVWHPSPSIHIFI